MQEDNTKAPSNPTPTSAPVDVPADSDMVNDERTAPTNETADSPVDAIPNNFDIMSEIIEKINAAQNILIALSSNPSVDEMAAAIGASLYLDKLGKRATAIYSGATPNALEFLKPEKTFESNVDTLQDFVIALSKEKADHLRYKLDGDFVKIYITPYRTRISEDDLDFSYGDFNIDLVLALDVANGIDLDTALREHGRIMHDASIVNITNAKPGKLGEVEWSDKNASSVSEMFAKLIYEMNNSVRIEKEEATAFLTGIVAATNRFSNAKTTPETMKIASELMESGANQQLVSKNITSSVENEIYDAPSVKTPPEEKPDQSKMTINHDDEKLDLALETKPESEPKPEPEEKPELKPDIKSELKLEPEPESESKPEEKPEPKPELKLEPEEKPELKLEPKPKSEPESPSKEEPNLLDDLKAAEADLAKASREEESKLDNQQAPELPKPATNPSTDESLSAPLNAGSNKYGQMLEEALSKVDTPKPDTPITSPKDNPAAMNAPKVPTKPEVNGVPSMDYVPMPSEPVLAPPPAPPIDLSSPLPEGAPAVPKVEIVDEPKPEPTPNPVANSIPKPVSEPVQPSTDNNPNPGAFKIPGM